MSIVPSAAEAVTEAGEGGLPPFVPPLWSFLSSPMPAKSAERAAVYPATRVRVGGPGVLGVCRRL